MWKAATTLPVMILARVSLLASIVVAVSLQRAAGPMVFAMVPFVLAPPVDEAIRRQAK